MEGFVKSDIDLASILSPEALAALQGLAVERGVVDTSDTASAEDIVGGLQKHFERSKIGDKEAVFHQKYGDIEFDVKGVKQSLGQTLDSTGLTIWRAAEHLCEYIMSNKSQFTGKHVCELGGGLGMVSILMHKLNEASSVVCTDGDEVSLKLLHENAQSTGVADDFVNEDGTTTSRMMIEKLYWGEHDEFIAKYPQIDTLVAADVIYEEDQIEPLLTTTVAILSKADEATDPKLILAYARRNVPIDRVYSCAERLGLAYELIEGDTEPIVKFWLKNGKQTVFR
jgi:predicted nicotinamide N-methyase